MEATDILKAPLRVQQGQELQHLMTSRLVENKLMFCWWLFVVVLDLATQ
jgi:hypothetical protein